MSVFKGVWVCRYGCASVGDVRGTALGVREYVISAVHGRGQCVSLGSKRTCPHLTDGN